MTDAEETAMRRAAAVAALGGPVAEVRDGLLDARSGLVRAMGVADEHALMPLHRELAIRVADLDNVLVLIDDLLAFVSPNLAAA